MLVILKWKKLFTAAIYGDSHQSNFEYSLHLDQSQQCPDCRHPLPGRFLKFRFDQIHKLS